VNGPHDRLQEPSIVADFPDRSFDFFDEFPVFLQGNLSFRRV
jgi:hypothetical protein